MIDKVIIVYISSIKMSQTKTVKTSTDGVKKKTSSKISDVQIFKNGKNLVMYPIFLECCNFTSDEFWKNMFEQMSYGKCPSCIYISNNTIHSSNKKKSFSFIIPTNKSPRDVFIELKSLLMENTSLCSIADTKAKREKIKSKVDKDEITNETTWTEIRKKNLKDIFIMKFVLRMRSKHKLSWEATKDLFRIIKIGLYSKTQTSKDINFSMKRIQSIDGIVYDGSKEFINEYENNDPPREREEQDDSNNYLFYYWDKYISSMSKGI